VVLLAASGCGLSLQTLPKLDSLSGPFYHLKAVFGNVVNLPASAAVREGAFQVGYVSGISANNPTSSTQNQYSATITMAIKKSVPLPKGTTAQVQFDTPLGEDFILLVPPSGLTSAVDYLPGSTIPESQTTNAPSVEDVLGALGALLNGGGLNQLQTIIVQTNDALRGNQPKIRSLLSSLSTTVNSFSNNTPAFDRALTAMSTLSQTLNQGSATIVTGIANLTPAVQVLQGETNDFNDLISQVDQLSSVANQVVTQSANGTVDTVQELDPVLNQLVGIQQDLAPALGAIGNFEAETPKTAPGDYLQASINANIEVPSVATNDLAPKVQMTYPAGETSLYTLLEGGLP
jgi:phospholipid/cholesterol/gamma-HCH transport system substrate-binding protein